MSKARTALFPPPHHMRQAEVINYLTRQVFDAAVKHGWLAPCLKKPGKGATIFYATTHVQDVSLRIAGGEYPGLKCEKGVLVPA